MRKLAPVETKLMADIGSEWITLHELRGHWKVPVKGYDPLLRTVMSLRDLGAIETAGGYTGGPFRVRKK